MEQENLFPFQVGEIGKEQEKNEQKPDRKNQGKYQILQHHVVYLKL